MTRKSDKELLARIEQWRILAEPVEKATGLKAIGYDPGVQFTDEDYTYSINLPKWFLERINKALEERPHA